MHEQLHAGSLKAIPFTAKRLGSVPGCIALGCADVGEATLEGGEKVSITWGLNLDAKRQAWFLKETFFRPIWISADNGSCELILPPETAGKLLPILNH